MEHNFLQVDGIHFKADDEKIILRGFGIGNWLNIEHFMIGIPGSESQIRTAIAQTYGENQSSQFWEKYLHSYLGEKDFHFLSKIGVNSIRLSFNYHHFESDLTPYDYNEAGFHHIDRILSLCEKYKIYAILDLHAAPGGQNPDWHSDNAIGEALLWEYREFQERVISLWKYIAKRYQSNQWIAGYDFLNEACYYEPQGKIVDKFYHELVSEVRKVDKNHIFFIEGDFYANFFRNFTSYDDPNIAYSFHFYPSLFRDTNAHVNSKTQLQHIEQALFGSGELNYVLKELKRPLWCGETGINFQRGNLEKFQSLLHDTISILEKYGISWAIWAYKDTRNMGCVRPKEESQWIRFSKLLSKDWRFGDEFKKYLISNEVIKNLGLTHLPQNVQRKLNFRLMANEHLIRSSLFKETLVKIPFDELITYPESFLFENCEVWEGVAEIIKQFAFESK
ncbi:MAG: cellulase family glycosylhydrolase [Candidatus Heimdallarchaeota archaeon]|nr:MAG: cellulase family glycosylhydrolase [Candidatus Heimdallarchaeota archaeon]